MALTHQEKTSSGIKVLMIDDDKKLCQLVADYLEPMGYEVAAAHDGAAGLEKALQGDYELLVLDVMMPGMDGFELCRHVKSTPQWRDIPIIMITSRTGAKHKEKAMEIGVDQYLGKPFQEEELVKDINSILKTSF